MKQNSNILIHHHAVAFIEKDKIWIQSFIGIWVQELSYYFDEIGLLIQTSSSKNTEQDYPITAKNIRIHQLNLDYKYKRFKRNKNIRLVCKKVSSEYDTLIVRGITPRQKLIFNNCDIKHKFYLLVGSLVDSKPTLRFSMKSLLIWSLYWLRRYELKKISRTAYMLANSPVVAQEIVDLLGVSARFIPTNTISQRDFKPLIIRTFGDPVKLLFCGRIVREKGIEELIESLKWLNDSGINATIDVVGSISEDYKVRLSGKIADLGLSSHITFHGFIPFGDNLLQFYMDSDIYVLPSWHEGFPHSVWEAAATCTPIIITRVGGIPGILNDQYVLFCEKGNSLNLANSIIKCLTNVDDTKARIISLYHLANDYTIDKCAEETYKMWAEKVC
jgi:glycosyltransferase involved in cell wall biosynthesis